MSSTSVYTITSRWHQFEVLNTFQFRLHNLPWVNYSEKILPDGKVKTICDLKMHSKLKFYNAWGASQAILSVRKPIRNWCSTYYIKRSTPWSTPHGLSININETDTTAAPGCWKPASYLQHKEAFRYVRVGLKVLPSLKERYKCQNNKFGRDYTAHTALLHVVYFSWKALYLNRASRPAASDSWSRCEPAGEKRWRNFTESGYFWQGFSFTHVNTKAPALPTLLFVYMHRHDRRLCAEEVKGDRQQTVEN